MKYYILAGEASGDLHASNLVKAILKKKPDAEIRAWGGDLMAASGAKIEKHIRELAFMGFAEVLMNLGKILNNFKAAKKNILDFQPDKVILVDYPGFNMRMAKWAKHQGFPITYYIAPQAWAWKEKRVEKLKKYVDELIVILPFEEKWFGERGVATKYFGHPLMDTDILQAPDRDAFLGKNMMVTKPIIALLPGSRSQELLRMSEVFIDVAKVFPDYQFVVAGAPGKSESDYKAYIDQGMKVVFDSTYDLLHCSAAALVTSGTATLETAIIGTPLIVCYRASLGTYLIAKNMIKIPYISLVNLIANKNLVPEILQKDCTVEHIKPALENILKDSSKQVQGFDTIRKQLGSAGVSDQIARNL